MKDREAFEAWAKTLTLGQLQNVRDAMERGESLTFDAWQAAVAHEREAAWEAIQEKIVEGPLPGNGWDETAQRNGMIIAANILNHRRNVSQATEARRGATSTHRTNGNDS